MINEEFERISKEIPLRTRIKVCSEMDFINLITELGYREDKMWTPEEDELLRKLMNLAHDHTNTILREIEGWEEDTTKCDYCGEKGCLGVCPYAEEIGGSVLECTCCSNCRGECASAI